MPQRDDRFGAWLETRIGEGELTYDDLLAAAEAQGVSADDALVTAEQLVTAPGSAFERVFVDTETRKELLPVEVAALFAGAIPLGRDGADSWDPPVVVIYQRARPLMVTPETAQVLRERFPDAEVRGWGSAYRVLRGRASAEDVDDLLILLQEQFAADARRASPAALVAFMELLELAPSRVPVSAPPAEWDPATYADFKSGLERWGVPVPSERYYDLQRERLGVGHG